MWQKAFRYSFLIALVVPLIISVSAHSLLSGLWWKYHERSQSYKSGFPDSLKPYFEKAIKDNDICSLESQSWS